MEGERRKRKLENHEEESEEEKLEKFYALIRRTKDVREGLANNKDKADKKEDFLEKDKGIWRPTFQPEDFIDDYYQQGFIRKSPHDSSSNPSVRPSPSTPAKHGDFVLVADKQPPQPTAPAPPPQTEDDEKKANDHLDLNLSL